MKNAKFMFAVLFLALTLCLSAVFYGGNAVMAAELHFTVTEPVGGTVTVTLNGENKSETSFVVATGDAVELSANPHDGYKFIGWDENGSPETIENANARVSYTVGDTDATVTAVFKKLRRVNFLLGNNNYSLNSAEDKLLADLTLPSQKYSVSGIAGETFEFILVPKDCVFIRWAENNKNGPDSLNITENADGRIKNEHGLVVKYRFTYTFPDKDDDVDLFCLFEKAYPVAVTTDAGADAVFTELIHNNISDASVSGATKIYMRDGDDAVIRITLKKDKEYFLDVNSMSGNLIPVPGEDGVYIYRIENFKSANPDKNIKVRTKIKTYEVECVDSEDCKIVLSKEKPYHKGDKVFVSMDITANDDMKPDGFEVVGAEFIANEKNDGGYFVIDGASKCIHIWAKPFVSVAVPETTYEITILQPDGADGYHYTPPTGGGTYAENSEAVLRWDVKGSPALMFIGWDIIGTGPDDGTTADIGFNNPSFQVAVVKNETYKPVVKVRSFCIFFDDSSMTVRADGTEISNGEAVKYGTVLSLSSKAADFDYWTHNGAKIAEGNATDRNGFALTVTRELHLAFKTKAAPVITPPVDPGEEDDPSQSIVINVDANDPKAGRVLSSNGMTLDADSPTTTLRAIAKDGYEFDHWELNGQNCGSESTITVTNVQAGSDYVAKFIPRMFNISYTPSTYAGGYWDGDTKAAVGTSVKIDIATEPGYKIASIKVNGVSLEFEGDKKTSVVIDNVTADQAVAITFAKVGFTDYEKIIIIVTVVIVTLFAACLLAVKIAKPNQNKLQRLIVARRSAMEVVGETSDAENDEETADDGNFDVETEYTDSTEYDDGSADEDNY